MNLEELIRVSSHQADMYGTRYEICIRDAMLRLRDAANKCAELQAKLESAEKEKSDALLESGKFWSEKYNHKLDEVIALHSKLDDLEKQEPIYQYSSTNGGDLWVDCDIDLYEAMSGANRVVYAKPIPAQQSNELYDDTHSKLNPEILAVSEPDGSVSKQYRSYDKSFHRFTNPEFSLPAGKRRISDIKLECHVEMDEF